MRPWAGGPRPDDPVVRRALAGALPRPFWTDRPGAPSRAALTGDTGAELVVVGGGFTGLWAALQALEEDPGRRVVVLEGRSVAWGASGRNGGFANASLTHGIANGEIHWPDEQPTLLRLAEENWCGLVKTVHDLDRDVSFEPVGKVTMAVTPHQVQELRGLLRLHERHGQDAAWLDADAARAVADSPVFLGGLALRSTNGLVDPAALAWALADRVESLGGVIHEATAVTGLEAEGAGVRVATTGGVVRAGRVVLGTNAYRPLLRRLRARVAPVYDHVLVTEPLSPDRLAALGWSGRQGITDAGNRFHYLRLTPDDRVLYGGWDATYHFGGRIADGLDQREPSHRLLVSHLLTTFPQLEGVGIAYRWGGPIDSTTRFTPAFGTALGGRVSWAVGYTGLGVGAARFGARVALDLVDGRDTERTRLTMVRRQPLPFPPEPGRWLAVAATKRALARADETGRRGPWLRLLDRLGIGFDT